MRVSDAEIVLILARPVGERPPARRRVLDRLEAAYEWLERQVLRGSAPALATGGSMSLPADIPTIRGAPISVQANAVRAADAHVLIDLVPEENPDPLPVPPAGRWHLRYSLGVGAARTARLARPRRSADLAESLLWIETGAGLGFETGAGVSALRRIGYSRDRDAVYWRSSLLAARRLERLVAGETVPSAADDVPVQRFEGRPSTAGASWAVPPFVALAATLAGRLALRLFFRAGWLVLVRPREWDQEPPQDLTGFKPVEAPAGRFYADPFVVQAEDGPRLYVEDCPVGAHRGRISALHLGAGQKAASRRWMLERVVLDDLEHRAYPHVLRTGMGLLLTPDGGRCGGVDLFIDHGPDVGVEHIGRCLEGVSASDPTLLWHDGRYWLFVTVTERGMSPWDELHLYTAAALTGMWNPHPRNPVVADVRRARSAGRIFWSRGRWVRPGQDCSVNYGRRIVLSAIRTLTLDEYEEQVIGSIEPSGVPGVQRTHTYTFDGSVEAVDVYRRALRRPGRGRLPQWARVTGPNAGPRG
jgi:hypothetical protein